MFTFSVLYADIEIYSTSVSLSQSVMACFSVSNTTLTVACLLLSQSVISYFSKRGLDEHLCSSMALDWLEREQRSPGRVAEELQVAQRELALARRRGTELRFYKERTEILGLALSQAYAPHRHHPSAPSPEQESASYDYEEEEELRRRPPPPPPEM